MLDRATTASPSEHAPLRIGEGLRLGAPSSAEAHAPPSSDAATGVATKPLGHSVREWLVNLLHRATWIKPPLRTARNLAVWVYSTWNIQRATEIRRVNVGCGKDVRAGWWNLDYIHFPGVDEIRDATKPWRHRELDCVFSEHFIEHLTLHQALDFLTHAGNALREGGVMRISTPNLTWVIRDAFDFTPPHLQKRLSDTVSINSCFHAYGHQFLFSEELMRFVLQELGFEDVTRYDFGQSDRAELRNLEVHGEFEIRDGVPNFIIFEAVKGTRRIEPSARLRAFLDSHFTPEGVYR